MELNKLKTLTGMTWEEVKAKMQEKLPDDAYKPIEGVAGNTLTDIDSAYMIEVITECFGPCGIGWGLSYPPEQVQILDQGFEAKQSRFLVSINHAEFWYMMGDPEKPYSITTSGGSTNKLIAFAIKGASTSAIGAAVSRLLFQLDVYKGKHDSGGTPARAKSGAGRAANVGGASEKQVNYISVMLDKDIPDTWAPKEDVRNTLRNLCKNKELTAAKASEYIEQLKAVADEALADKANQELDI